MSLQTHHQSISRRIYQLELRQGVALHEREVLKRLMDDPEMIQAMEGAVAPARGATWRRPGLPGVQFSYTPPAPGVESIDPKEALHRLELLEAQIRESKVTISRLRRSLAGVTRKKHLDELDRIREQLETRLPGMSVKSRALDVQAFVSGNRRLIWRARVIAMACGVLFPEWSEDFTGLPVLRRRELFRKIGKI